MQNLFLSLPEDFFKPLTSKYKREYADCIQLIFNTFKPEISYGVNREIIASVLENYFENDETDMIFEEEQEVLSDARAKANKVIKVFRDTAWIEYEQAENHQINVVLFEYAVPIIESFNKIIKAEETEYQGIISQIHAALQNKDLYVKPYELILKGVAENTDRLISELKKLNASIKRHMDKQTNEMGASEILEHFFAYHKNIGSKAYLRMKTSENVSYFRSAIMEKLEEFITSPLMMDSAVTGYMEIEQVADREEAYDCLLQLILDVKSSFYRLDEIIEEIDRKHAKYIKNAVVRAKFLLSTGNNMEGKILKILDDLTDEINADKNQNIYEKADRGLLSIFKIYPQNFIDNESLRTIPVTRQLGVVDAIDEGSVLSEEERALFKAALKEKNRNRFSRKNINTYVEGLLRDQERLKASTLPIESKRDLIRLIYISIYGNNRSNCYRIERTNRRIKINEFEFPDFEIVKA